jgi:sugar phosphate permease
MTQQRWLRIIPVALVMYTISYVDRTNVSLALDPTLSTMMRDLLMDDRMKGEAAGIFFLGYVLLQVPGGYWATRWSPRRVVALLLICWGACAVGCGLSRSFRQFEVMRFLLGVAESGVFPATLVLLANWFPRGERARATAYWTLCQPLAVAASAPITGWLLGAYGWKQMLILEGLLPFLWLPLWWFCIRDHPHEARWIAADERSYLETTLQREAAELESSKSSAGWRAFSDASVWVLIAMYFLQNCAAYGCMTFFTSSLKGRGFSGLEYGVLFGIPYAMTAVIMVLNSWHSDLMRERRGHVALVYCLSGISLILSVTLQERFWLSYALMCLAITGPFAAMGPFWAIPSESLPRGAAGMIVGLVNAFGNVGGFAGPYITGWLKQEYHSLAIAFSTLGAGLVIGAALAFLLPRPARQFTSAEAPER